MADISVRRKHGMEYEEAKGKVHQIVEDLQSSMDFVDKVSWNGAGDAADVKGKGFSGNFRVDDDEVVIEIDLKLLAKPFKGKIQDKVEQRMDRYFG